ncbi:MAG: hypothetical protein ABIK78_05000, partial [candidate division WOR-3 bacterium]
MGKKRIALRLKLNEWTVRNVLRQNVIRKKRKERKGFFPAFWSWEIEEPFSHAQVDTKDILDKATLGTELYQKFSLLKLPRYQWTFCESISSFRFLSYSHRLNQENGFLFVGLVMMWLRCWGIDKEVFWQEDWGEEFGGDNPYNLKLLNERRYKIYGAVLGKAPKRRKGYQGRVERSYKTDDEEF